jgi:hypothetical protein
MAQEQSSNSKNEKDITAFDVESYIQQRWNSQRNYFSKSSQKKQKYFNRCQILIILLSALSVTILTVDLDYFTGLAWTNKVICAILSLAVIVISGVDKLKQYNAEWIKDRKATEKLKSEICKYKFGVEPYTVPIKSAHMSCVFFTPILSNPSNTNSLMSPIPTVISTDSTSDLVNPKKNTTRIAERIMCNDLSGFNQSFILDIRLFIS